ncbi:2-keto-4-pentenoate hydratase [Marinovum sp.]|uniref:2-keto-4-pentenoate hydratase n=1 Tax=Marinovum sp. TaxID=2024839 RepID=UPI002B276E36|nr:2-keto-4-pentenoate hydratase [Marinovum sp.]
MNNLSQGDLLVDAMLQARRSGRPVDARRFTESPLSERDAYAVQAGVVAACGPVGAFKVANKPDAPRIMAPILAADLIDNPAELAVPANEAIGIELEIAFRVDAPLPPRDAPDRRRRVADCLSALPVIEIVRTRLTDDATPMLKLADNQINGGLVLGAPVKAWQDLPMGEIQASLRCGDDLLLDGAAKVPGGDAFENFLVLEEMVGDHCGGLNPGQVVITGSLNGLPYVKTEAAILGRIDGLGEVSLHLGRPG